ncbi:MAG TPA: alpha/beta hydrolase [Candidatus Binatia bacterium]|nr:alpha/beta hydrolase [Candidatus Binatia bacterium]
MENNRQHEVDVRDAEYQRIDGKPWLIRLYQPQGAGPFPALIDVHGGAWHNGDRTNNGGVDQALAERGILVAAVDFRQPPEAGYPASVCDINLATRWLKAHARELHATTSVGAFGNSSGGHQAVLSALRPRHAAYTSSPLSGHPDVDASVKYVIAAWPVIDPLYRYNYAKEFKREELVSAHNEYWGTEAAMMDGNPQKIVERGEQQALPPIYVALKTNDRNHPVEMEERFIATYRKRGGTIEVDTFDGLPEHRIVPSPEKPETMRFVEAIAGFVCRHA